MSEVKVQIAFRWDCPSCGALNYQDSSPQDLAELPPEAREKLDPELNAKSCITIPMDVTCTICRSDYRVDIEQLQRDLGLAPGGQDG